MTSALFKLKLEPKNDFSFI